MTTAQLADHLLRQAQKDAAKQGYLLARLSDGLRITQNGITVKRWKDSFDVLPVIDWLNEQQRGLDEFLSRR